MSKLKYAEREEKILWYTRAKGKMSVDKMKDEERRRFAEDGESILSVSYLLRERAKIRKEREMNPVRKWDRKEAKVNISIKRMYLDSEEVRYFKKKYRDPRKNMKPKLLGTEIAPRKMRRGKAEPKRLARAAILSSPPSVLVIMKVIVGINIPKSIGACSR